MSKSQLKTQSVITFKPSVESKMTKQMVNHLDTLLSFKEPIKLKDSLMNFFLETLTRYHHDEDDLQSFGFVAEDLYFIHQFLTGLDEEIRKCNES
ncbi:MAG: hypothetical protein WBA74_27895 [Cyclobacteriaceae bacterium]